MKVILFSIYFSFFIGGLVFCSHRKYLLIMLLMLELMVLNVFMLLNFFFFFMNLDWFFLLVYMVIIVGEGVLGISIMVAMLRGYGMDYFNVNNILMW